MSSWKTILGALAALFALNEGAKAVGRKLGKSTYSTNPFGIGKHNRSKETKD